MNDDRSLDKKWKSGKNYQYQQFIRGIVWKVVKKSFYVVS